MEQHPCVQGKNIDQDLSGLGHTENDRCARPQFQEILLAKTYSSMDSQILLQFIRYILVGEFFFTQTRLQSAPRPLLHSSQWRLDRTEPPGFPSSSLVVPRRSGGRSAAAGFQCKHHCKRFAHLFAPTILATPSSNAHTRGRIVHFPAAVRSRSAFPRAESTDTR